MLLFLLPPIESLAPALVPWVVGALFVGADRAEPVLRVVQSRPNTPRRARCGWLPVELTLLNDLPVTTRAGARAASGSATRRAIRAFQVYFLDDNAYGRETARLLDARRFARGSGRQDRDAARTLRLTLHDAAPARCTVASDCSAGARPSRPPRRRARPSVARTAAAAGASRIKGTQARGIVDRVECRSGGFVPLSPTRARTTRGTSASCVKPELVPVSTVAVVTSSPPFVEGGHLVIARALVRGAPRGRPRRRPGR